MATNNVPSPTTFTFPNGILIGDLVESTSGSNDSIPLPTIVAGLAVSACLELQSTTSALLVPRMTNTELNTIETMVDGMIAFDSTNDEFVFRQGGSWDPIPNVSVGGPGTSTNHAIARWNGTTGNLLMDSLVTITNAGTVLVPDGSVTIPSYAFTSAAVGLFLESGIIKFASDNAVQFAVSPTVSAVNYIQVFGGSTGNPPSLKAQGSDANISLLIDTKGTGQIISTQTGSQSLPTFTWAGQTNDGIFTTGVGQVAITTKGNKSVIVTSANNAVNFWQMTASATGNALSLDATGTDTNISLTLSPKGAGQVLNTTLGTAALPSYSFVTRTTDGIYSDAAGSVSIATGGVRSLDVFGPGVDSYLKLDSSVSNIVALSTLGTNANIKLQLSGKGIGNVCITDTNNLLLGYPISGALATVTPGQGVLAIHTTTVPLEPPTLGLILYQATIDANNSTLGIQTRGAGSLTAGAPSGTANGLRVIINGATFYIELRGTP